MSKGKYKTRNRMVIVVVALALIGGILLAMSFQSGYDPFDPSNYPPPGVSQPKDSATVYQAFFVTYADGTRWYYPKERTALAIIGPHGEGKAIKSLQTHIFMNVNYDTKKAISSWSFSCNAKFSIIEWSTQSTLTDFGFQPVSISGTSLAANKDVWLTSASATSIDLTKLASFQHGKEYVFKVQLRNISIKLTYADGSVSEMNAIGGPSNDLEWRFLFIQG